jgi:hypothetical protein
VWILGFNPNMDDDLPWAVCHANQSAKIAMSVAVIPKHICSIESSSMTSV